MRIDSFCRVELRDLVATAPAEYIRLHYGSEGAVGSLIGLSWNYNTQDRGLHVLVKKNGGVWQHENGWWFQDDERLDSFLNKLKKRHPDWPVVSDKMLTSLSFEQITVCKDSDACLLLNLPLPFPFNASALTEFRIYRLSSGSHSLGLLRGTESAVEELAQLLKTVGASNSTRLALKWGISADHQPLVVKSEGWAASVDCDLSNLNHLQLAPDQEYRWQGTWPNSKKVPTPWLGSLKTTQKKWPELLGRIEALGITWSGDDPAADIASPLSIHTDQIAGWTHPAPNGHLLHQYQKVGVEFCASRGMHALIGDEMGIGKTAQAIVAAQALGASQVFVICPKNARYVWDREIQGWCGSQERIQHIRNQADSVSIDCRWHILTYEQLVSKQETWTFENSEEEKVVLQACPHLESEILRDVKTNSAKVVITAFCSVEPDLTPERLARWRKLMMRVRGALLAQILDLGPVTMIVDEAHRAKNIKSKRSQSIAKIAEQHRETNVLLLTGTPLRNNEHEAAVLLGYLDPDAKQVLSKANGYSIEDVKDYLSYFMIRRTKAEVMPELPEKTRQRVDLDALEPTDMKSYGAALQTAVEAYLSAIEAGHSEADARNQMRGGIEQARSALGMAKVNGGQVADLVADVVEDKQCCVVFCVHHAVSDTLKDQLQAMGLKAAVIDGRTTSARKRAETEAAFQAGDLDVLIGGIYSAGEAIHLTRADTVIFVELEYVPTALKQAEDRIHRQGQKASCLVLHLVAKFDETWSSLQNFDESLIDIIGSKMERIGSVLDEDTSNLVASEARSQIAAQILQKHGGFAPDTSTQVAPSAQSSVVDKETLPAWPKSSLEKLKWMLVLR